MHEVIRCQRILLTRKTQLSDPTRHILIRTAHEVLTYDKCVDLRKTDQGGHHNHWVSVSTVGVK